MNERLTIALPNGELKKDVVKFIGDIGFEISPTERGLLIPVGNMPIEFVLVRAGDVPRVVRDERSVVKAGITGSDILWESGIGKEAGDQIPIYELNPEAKRSSLYLGASDDFMDYILEKEERKFVTRDLSGMMLATKYINIARDYIRQQEIKNVEVLYVPGSDEGMQYVYPSCVALIGIKSTGETLRANNVQVVDQFHDVALRMIQESAKLSPKDARVLADFRERMEKAVSLNKPVSSAYL